MACRCVSLSVIVRNFFQYYAMIRVRLQKPATMKKLEETVVDIIRTVLDQMIRDAVGNIRQKMQCLQISYTNWYKSTCISFWSHTNRYKLAGFFFWSYTNWYKSGGISLWSYTNEYKSAGLSFWSYTNRFWFNFQQNDERDSLSVPGRQHRETNRQHHERKKQLGI